MIDDFVNSQNKSHTALDKPLCHLIKPADPDYCQAIDLDDNLATLKKHVTMALNKLMGETLQANNITIEDIKGHLNEPNLTAPEMAL